MLQKQPRSARESCKQDSFLLRKIRVSKASVDTVPRQIAQIKMYSFRCANHSDEPLGAKKCVHNKLPHFFVSHLHSTVCSQEASALLCVLSPQHKKSFRFFLLVQSAGPKLNARLLPSRICVGKCFPHPMQSKRHFVSGYAYARKVNVAKATTLGTRKSLASKTLSCALYCFIWFCICMVLYLYGLYLCGLYLYGFVFVWFVLVWFCTCVGCTCMACTCMVLYLHGFILIWFYTVFTATMWRGAGNTARNCG